jgi:two-component system OmpR family response regulator
MVKIWLRNVGNNRSNAQKIKWQDNSIRDILLVRMVNLAGDSSNLAKSGSLKNLTIFQGDRKKVLIVEDDQTLVEVLKYNLAKEGYQTLSAFDGVSGLEIARQDKPDLIILDLMLPGLSGFEVCRILRQETAVPILILTAKTAEVDKVLGLELGADDYLTKPFSLRELLARVRALLRRSEIVATKSTQGTKLLRADDLVVDLNRHEATLHGSPLNLKPKEFELLAFLVQNKGRAFSREQLLEDIWEYEYEGDTRTIDVHIRWLREKIEPDPSHPIHLLTVRGIGYRFEG